MGSKTEVPCTFCLCKQRPYPSRLKLEMDSSSLGRPMSEANKPDWCLKYCTKPKYDAIQSAAICKYAQMTLDKNVKKRKKKIIEVAFL